MGAVDREAVKTVTLEDVEPIPLPGGSWNDATAIWTAAVPLELATQCFFP